MHTKLTNLKMQPGGYSLYADRFTEIACQLSSGDTPHVQLSRRTYRGVSPTSVSYGCQRPRGCPGDLPHDGSGLADYTDQPRSVIHSSRSRKTLFPQSQSTRSSQHEPLSRWPWTRTYPICATHQVVLAFHTSRPPREHQQYHRLTSTSQTANAVENPPPPFATIAANADTSKKDFRSVSEASPLKAVHFSTASEPAYRAPYSVGARGRFSGPDVRRCGLGRGNASR